MNNNYQIKEGVFSGFPFIEVCGDSFSHGDLYEFVGKNQFMCTFVFKTGSESLIKYGQSVTGVLFYAKSELNGFENLNKEMIELEERRLKIDSPMLELSITQREELKYAGLLITDINSISFIPQMAKDERHESGEKIVPNIINITYDDNPKIDCDILYQNYIVLKNNSHTELIPYEKEKFIGITLGINDGHIDSRLLNHLGYNPETVHECTNIMYHFLKTKKRRNTLSEEDESTLSYLEVIRWSENYRKLLKEIKKSGVDTDELSKSRDIIETIISSLKDFEPDILLHGKKQVFWDVESYLHIVLRHVKQLQIGRFKEKTPFTYKFGDLEMLIMKVLGSVEDEIRRHLKEKPGKDFTRHGKMSVLFNKDYYSFKIDKQGRLEAFYAI